MGSKFFYNYGCGESHFLIILSVVKSLFDNPVGCKSHFLRNVGCVTDFLRFNWKQRKRLEPVAPICGTSVMDSVDNYDLASEGRRRTT